MRVSGFHVQKAGYDGMDRYLVSKHSEKIWGEVFFWHDITSYGS
jgi:hypothetical protein